MKRFDIIWIFVLLGISAILLIPETRDGFVLATQKYPYPMGFVKFAIFASMGEFLAVRIVNGDWMKLKGTFYRVAIWGVIGMMIVFMFPLYQAGIEGVMAKGYLVQPAGWAGNLFRAFMISAVMNLTFAPVFMASHRISDTYLDLYYSGQKPTLAGVIHSIDWPAYLKFIVGKTIPFFWIPAHTITFLLPAEFRVIYAAYLSIALGAILAYARRRKQN
jgi:hypothetical protein